MAIETAPVANVTTPAKASQRHRIPTLAERMHKALYPEMYVNGRPIEGVQVSKPVKAKKVEKKTIRST